MTTSTKIRIALALLVAIALGFVFWQEQAKESKHAQELLAGGEKVTASVVSATVKSKKKWGVTTSRRADVDYEFTAADGKNYTGNDDIDADLVDAMSDPADASALKDDASIEIVYLKTNPADNGALAQLNAHREFDYSFPLIAAAIAAVVAWFASGRVLGWFNRG